MLQLHHISKSFPAVKVLQDISLTFNVGEIHALCGENGAGKSTLMNIITGNLQPDEGVIFFNDHQVNIADVQTAQQLGIGIVYQERSLVGSLSVAENIYPVNQPLNRFGCISYKQLYQQTQVLLNELQLTGIASAARVDKLSAAQQQMVEIAKALAQQPALLILDEPTASITHHETAILFEILRDLKKKGVAIIYISHRMPEIKAIADVVSILKDGILQGTYDVASISAESIVTTMVGRTITQMQFKSNATVEVALEVKNISGKHFHGINFKLYKGEILGFAGLQGSGRTELALAIFGDENNISGRIIKENKTLQQHHPADAINNGFAYLPDDRKTAGLFLEQSLSDNIASAQLQNGYYQKNINHDISRGYVNQLGIRTTSVLQKMQKLSGGNQQKVVLAKWLHTKPDILIVNEPTHGVDVGAKADIYRILNDLTANGKSILLISSELPELLLLSDRVVVMYKGSIQEILERDVATEERITSLASGFK
ncbi:sugar ABC transporter ATP-binding protein [soil metagenome]